MMMLGCMHVLLLAETTTQRVAAVPAASPDAGEPALSSPASLPLEILRSAEQGELQKVVKWLRQGGPIDALCSAQIEGGQTTTAALLHVAATNGHLEMVKVLLKRGASVDLQTGIGYTALMTASGYGRLSILSVLLQHSANPNLQSSNGQTALIIAAGEGQEACVQALLRAGANTELRTNDGRAALRWAEQQGHEAAAELIRQHAAPLQLAVAPSAAPPDAGEAAEYSPPTSLPREIFQSAQQGKLKEVVKWLGAGGPIDASCSVPTDDGRTAAVALLHTTAASGRREAVRVLLKRGASVDLQSSLGGTALMGAASFGHLSTLLLLLQHSANPDLQDKHGNTALMMAAGQGQEACVQALLDTKANTELLDNQGRTALQWAEAKGHFAAAKLFKQHACRSLGLGVALCAVLPLARPWMAPWVVVLGAIALVAFSRTLTAGLGQHRAAARQRRPHRHTKAKGRTTITEPIRQHAAPPQPAAAVAPHAMEAKQPARADAAMEEPLAEEAAEQAKGQARSKKSKKKTKAGRPTAPEDGGLAALERALVAVPREVREGDVAAEARARSDKLMKWRQEEAEREARQQAAAEAAKLAMAERVQGVAVWEEVWVAPPAEAREEAEAATMALATAIEEAAAAAAIVDALEQVMAVGSDVGSDVSINGAAGPRSEASKAAEVPDDYMCSITAEIMTDPVCTSDGFTYEREAITEWLRTNDTSPLTGATLESKVLISNLSFRSIIRRFVAAQASTAL